MNERYNRMYSTVSAAHTYGNVAAIMSEHIRALFPPNTFKTLYVASKIAYKEFDFTRNSVEEFKKKRSPMLVIRPRLLMEDSDTFMAGTLATSRLFEDFDNRAGKELDPFFRDDNSDIFIRMGMNRMSMEFECVVIVDSSYTQINMIQYMKNRIRFGKTFDLKCSMEDHIPKYLIELVSRDANLPIKDSKGSVKRFMDYLNSKSIFPVTYRRKNASGNNEFFRHYPNQLNVTFDNFSFSDIEKNNMIEDNAQITFNVKVDFWAAGTFYYFTKSPDTMSNDFTSIVGEKEGHLEPIFSIDLSEPGARLPEGFQLYQTMMYQTDECDEDTIDLTEILDTGFMNIMEYCTMTGINKAPFVEILLMKGNRQLRRGLEFDFDLDKLELYTFKCKENSNYRLFIYYNKLAVNQLNASLLVDQNDLNLDSYSSAHEGIPTENYTKAGDETLFNPQNFDSNGDYVKRINHVDDRVYYDIGFCVRSTNTIMNTDDMNSNIVWLHEKKKNENLEISFIGARHQIPTLVVPEDWNKVVSILDEFGDEMLSMVDYDYIDYNGRAIVYSLPIMHSGTETYRFIFTEDE